MAEEVDSDFSLWEEEIPTILGEGWVNAGEDGDEMGFEGADGSFSLISAMHVRWHFLVSDIPCVVDAVDICGASFVVEDLHIDCVATGF